MIFGKAPLAMSALIRRLARMVATVLVGFSWASQVSAIELVDYSAIAPIGNAIQFSEVPYRTANPTYRVGPAVGGLNISFGSHFLGQVLGAMPNTLSDTTPNGPLTLSSLFPVVTSIDLAHGSIALGGAGRSYFTTPISIHFDQPVSEVGFRVGHFDRPGNILFEAYNAIGQSLGIVNNPRAGVSNLGIRRSGNQDQISGVSIYMRPGDMDWEGYTIDNVIVGRPGLEEGDTESTSTPEPSTLAIWGVLMTAVALRKSWRVR